MIRQLLPCALALLLPVALAASVRAQDGTVARAQTLAESGKYTEARAVLARWWQREGERLRDHDVRAGGLLLRGRLAQDPTNAAQDYLTIVLEHPRTSQAPEALLRLGQHFLTIGDAKRSTMYLKRLVSDYPAAPERPTALLFLARAHRAAGADVDACKVVKQAVAPASDAELGALVRTEEAASCQAVATKTQAPRRPETRTPPATPPPSAGARKNAEKEVAGTGVYALQSGAFREVSGALELAGRLERAGYTARVVRTRGALALVRVGRFRTTQEAVEVARGMRGKGYTALVVDDAALEKPVKE